MKKSIIAIFLSAFFLSANAQTIRIESGVGISSMRPNEPLNWFTKNVFSPATQIGIDYWENRFFYLSSRISYVSRGGTDVVTLREYTIDLNGTSSFIHLGTTFRTRLPLERFDVFAGVGPFVGFQVGSNYFYGWGTNNPVLFGITPEFGFDFLLTESLSLGFNFVYNHSFTPMIRQHAFAGTMYNNFSAFFFSLGYRFR